MLLELEGGTTHERLTASTGWSRKGTGGLLKRLSGELIGDDTHAYEFRTLVTTGSDQLRAVLSLAQKLEVLLREDPQSWSELKKGLETKLVEYGFPLHAWGSPIDNPGLWQRYSEAFVSNT